GTAFLREPLMRPRPATLWQGLPTTICQYLIIRNSSRVLTLFTVRTVISAKRSVCRDLSTTLEMTTC
ncbi:MAG: hypothetical protein ACI3Y6_03525, partial [Candidatus Cryptobacteroides sp.]